MSKTVVLTSARVTREVRKVLQRPKSVVADKELDRVVKLFDRKAQDYIVVNRVLSNGKSVNLGRVPVDGFTFDVIKKKFGKGKYMLALIALTPDGARWVRRVIHEVRS